MITAVGIVVPAHNEAELLGACLGSIAEATRCAAAAGVAVELVVVLDSCSDGTRDVAEAAFGSGLSVSVVEIDAGNVGRARAVGIAHVLGRLRGHAREATWIASTDADSRVPRTWLLDHIHQASGGADAVAGVIEVDDWGDHPAGTQERFEAQYVIEQDGSHAHVHGANLGIRASTYLTAGGMPHRALAEDHSMLNALVAMDATVARTSAVSVTTSARRIARATGGFSDLLVGL